MTDNYIRGTLLRIGVAATTAGVAALALASPASATIIDRYIDVPQCAEPQTQVCEQIPIVTFRAKYGGPILVEFTANQNHCSDMIAHIIVDGTEWGSNTVGPGQKDGGYEIPMTAGDHTIGVQAEGIEGGCNVGFVSAWGGTLHIETLYDDSKGTTGLTRTTRERSMSFINTRTGGAIAAAAAIGAAAIVLAGPATADEKLITEKYIASEECATVGAGQLCPANPTNYWSTRTQFLARTPAIKVEFTANPNHCSDIIAHVFVSGPGYNGEEWGSNILQPGQSDGGYEIPVHDAGLHQIGVQAEGIEGGCNIGFLDSWGGMLRIWQIT